MAVSEFPREPDLRVLGNFRGGILSVVPNVPEYILLYRQ